jgi:hypothetical protein
MHARHPRSTEWMLKKDAETKELQEFLVFFMKDQ